MHVFLPPGPSFKEVTGWFAVQRKLTSAVSRHSDSHQAQQDGHARHCRSLPALQHSLGCLSLKERAGVTAQVAMAPSTRPDHHRGPRRCVSSIPPAPGSDRVHKEETLVTYLSHLSNTLPSGRSRTKIFILKWQYDLTGLINKLFGA